MALENKPYTYLIGWSKYNKYYYGVRYSKKCHPSDLWVKYFTSSKHVKKFRDEHGEPDIIQVRRLFDDKERAILWESKILKKMNVISNDKWLNVSDNKAISNIFSFKSIDCLWINNGLIEKYIKKYEKIPEGWNKGRIYIERKKTGSPSEETRLKIKIALTGKKKPAGHGEKVGNYNRGKKRSADFCKAVSNGRKGITTHVKTWEFIYNNSTIHITNLSKYCRENNLNVSCMRDVYYGNQKQHKNYKKAI